MFGKSLYLDIVILDWLYSWRCFVMGLDCYVWLKGFLVCNCDYLYFSID